MAVVTVKSGPITNRDASPQVKNNSFVENGMLRSVGGVAPVGNGDSIASVYLMAAVPSSARVSSLLLFCDAITSGTANVGIYASTDMGGAAVSASLFAAAQTIATASTTGIELVHAASGSNGIANIEKPLWLLAGLSKDPCVTYYIGLALAAATTAAGNVAVEVKYAI